MAKSRAVWWCVIAGGAVWLVMALSDRDEPTCVKDDVPQAAIPESGASRGLAHEPPHPRIAATTYAPVCVKITDEAERPLAATVELWDDGALLASGRANAGAIELTTASQPSRAAMVKASSPGYDPQSVPIQWTTVGVALRGTANISMSPARATFALTIQVLQPDSRPITSFTAFVLRSRAAAEHPGAPQEMLAATYQSPDGRAQVEGLGFEVIDVRIRATGYPAYLARGISLAGSSPAKPATHVIIMSHGASLSGYVEFSGDGSWPADLSVAAVPAGLGFSPRGIDSAQLSAPFAEAHAQIQRVPLTASSGIQSFQIAGLSESDYQVGVVDGIGRLRSDIGAVHVTSVAADYGPVTLHMNAGVAVHAKVLFEGVPRKVTVTLAGARAPSGTATRFQARRFELIADSDRNGEVVFAAVPPGDYEIDPCLSGDLPRLAGGGLLQQMVQRIVELSDAELTIHVGSHPVHLAEIDLGSGLARYDAWLAAHGRVEIRKQIRAHARTLFGKAPAESALKEIGAKASDLAFYGLEANVMALEQMVASGAVQNGDWPGDIQSTWLQGDVPGMLRAIVWRLS